MKFVEIINYDLECLANEWALNNAHGIPNSKGYYQLDNIKRLPEIELNTHTPTFLRELADIVEKYF